jgi:hypothetical protein
MLDVEAHHFAVPWILGRVPLVAKKMHEMNARERKM